MRSIEENSLSDFIIYNCCFILIMVAAILILCVSCLYNTTISSDIEKKLKRSNELYSKTMHVYNSKFTMTEEFYTRDVGGIARVILDSTGHLVAGSYPDALLDNKKYDTSKIYKVYSTTEEYYVMDQTVPLVDSVDGHTSEYVLRSFIQSSDMEEIYRKVRMMGYVSIVLIMLSCMIIVFYMLNKIQKPMKDLSEMAMAIGKTQDFSQRMEVREDTFSEIKSLVDANNNILEQAEKLIEIQKQFSTDVAHELKTPMTVISAECQYARKYLTENSEMKETLEIIEQQAKKTSQIVSQLFQLTRLEQDQIKIDFEYIDLSEIVESVCDSESMIARKNITLIRDIDSCYAEVDINLMMIAIRNILNNAAKNSKENSQIDVLLKKEKDTIVFLCQDYGVGMDEEDQKHIFQRFYRSDSSRSSEGLGLGLPITKKIIEIHGGNILINSIKGQGSTFMICFPLKS